MNAQPERPQFDTAIDSASFHELAQQYVADTSVPETPWLTKLNLESPRTNIDSLPVNYLISKRAIDIFGSIALGILLTPVWMVVPVIIKITSGPGPVIYRQPRVGLNRRLNSFSRRSTTLEQHGKDLRSDVTDRRIETSYGKSFTLYKFRSMGNNAEKNGAMLAQANDNRVTKFGKFMRKTRIDEIPQLINVLRGEMSLVGPRPERAVFVEQLSSEIPQYLDRLGLQPGITGVAQIENGYDTDTESFRRKVAYDLQYLQNCNTRNDLKILWRTVHTVLTGKGAL